MVEGAMSRLGRKASVAALVAGVLVAVASSAGAGARSSHRGGLPAACASLDAPTPPVRAVPGTAATNGPYAIFRRPQAPADLLPPDAAGQLDTLASYDPTATRLVFTTGVARVYLVRGRRQKLVVPGACLSRLPRAYARTVRLLERELAGQAAVCFSLEQTRHRANGAVEQSASTGCVPAVAGTGGYAVVTLEGNSALEVGLVPDGVARVDVRYRTGRTVEGTVRTNIVAYRPPSLTVGGQGLRGPRRAVARRLRRLILDSIPAQVTWRDARGQVLRTFTPPPALLREVVVSGTASLTLSTTSGSPSSVPSPP